MPLRRILPRADAIVVGDVLADGSTVSSVTVDGSGLVVLAMTSPTSGAKLRRDVPVPLDRNLP